MGPRVRVGHPGLASDALKDGLQSPLCFRRQRLEFGVADELHQFLCVDHCNFDLLPLLPNSNVARQQKADLRLGLQRLMG